MSADLSDRQDALRLFVARSRERLKQLLQHLQWSQDGVRQLHREANVPDTADQLPLSFLADAEHTVQLSAEQLQQLLGTITEAANTFDQLQANYSTAQKLQIYEHVIKSLPSQRISFEDNAQFAELVAVTKKSQQKQRRHRKSKPTLREEMHQLLELQMQALRQQLYQEFAAKERLHPPQSQLNKHHEEAYKRCSPSRKLIYIQSRNSSRQRSRSGPRERSRQRQRSSSRRQRQRSSSHSSQVQHSSRCTRQRQRSSSRSRHRQHSSSRSRQRQRSSSRSRHRQYSSSRSRQRQRSSSRSRQRQHSSSRSRQRQRSSSHSRQVQHSSSRKRSRSRQAQRSQSKVNRRSRSPRQKSKRHKRSN